MTPSLSGTQVLSVEAKDVRSRWGAPAEFSFKVAPAAGATGTWHFDDALPGSGVTIAKDTAAEGTRHDATLYTAGAAGPRWPGAATPTTRCGSTTVRTRRSGPATPRHRPRP